MAEPSDRRLLLASARADLLDGAAGPDCPGVPHHVAASWRRSVSNGVPPAGVESQYFTDLEFESRLVRCAQPVIDQLVEQIADVPMCVALTDNRARILARRDSNQWIGRILDRVYFAKGFGYAEGTVGTNGVGTVLEFGESVHIVGAEHFVDNLQSFACAGAPVHDPFTGRIEGVLDISCLSDHSTPLMHSLVRSAAHRIEHNLVLDRNQAQQALFDVYTRVDSRTRDAVLAVGPQVVIANNAMQTLLGSGDQEALHDHIRFAARAHSRVDDRIGLPSGVRIRLRGSTVALGDDVAGMIGVVTLLPDDDGAGGSRGPAALATGTASGRRGPVESRSPGVRAAEATVDAAVHGAEPVLVLGESGSGRFTLLAEAAHRRRPGVRVERIPASQVDDDPDAVARRLTAPSETLWVLCDVDRIAPPAAEALHAALGAHVVAPGLLGATICDTGEGPHRSLLRAFRHSATLPPLRHRTADLPALARAILEDLAPQRQLHLSPEASRVLGRYRWPGNMRELHEVLGTAADRRPVGVIEAEDLPAYCQSTPRGTLRQVDQAERDVIVQALRQAHGNRRAAAKELGLARSTLYRKIRQYGITD